MKWGLSHTFASICLFAMPGLAQAQAVRSVATASNGVQVTVYSDEFAQRYEYTSPYTKTEQGQIAFATVKKGGVTEPIELSGFFVYSGEWRRYNSAVFKGGDAAKFTSTGRDVGQCYSSAYSRPTCTLTESFSIAFTPAELKAHEEADMVSIQVRAADTSAVIFQIPLIYLRALADVAKVDINPPAPVPVTTPPPAATKPPLKPAPRKSTRKR